MFNYLIVGAGFAGSVVAECMVYKYLSRFTKWRAYEEPRAAIRTSEHVVVSKVGRYYGYTQVFENITEFKHLTGQIHPETSIVYEYPASEGDPYYPMARVPRSTGFGSLTKLCA